MEQNPSTIEARKLRNAKYALEDFNESVDKTKIVARICLLLALLMLISAFVFNTKNLPYSVDSLLLGFIILIAPQMLNLRIMGNVILLIGIYFAFVFVEIIAFGLPAPLIPDLDLIGRVKIVGLVALINGLTPFMYTGIKIAITYLLFNVIRMGNKLNRLPSDMKEKIGLH